MRYTATLERNHNKKQLDGATLEQLNEKTKYLRLIGYKVKRIKDNLNNIYIY